MNATSSLLRILPETVLTLTGVLVMLIEPLLPKERSRAPLGMPHAACCAARCGSNICR